MEFVYYGGRGGGGGGGRGDGMLLLIRLFLFCIISGRFAFMGLDITFRRSFLVSVDLGRRLRTCGLR